MANIRRNTGCFMNIGNPLRGKRRRAGGVNSVHQEIPMNLLSLIGKGTEDDFLDSFLRNTSIVPVSLLDRLAEFGKFYEIGIWNIGRGEVSHILEAFRNAYEMVLEEDRKTGINTCKGYCKKHGISCFSVELARCALVAT